MGDYSEGAQPAVEQRKSMIKFFSHFFLSTQSAIAGARKKIRVILAPLLRRLKTPRNRLADSNSLFVALLIFFGMMVPIGRAYLAPGYQLGHDRAVPYMRVMAIEDAVTEGQLPPRWFPEFDGGNGSPYPSFYGMLFYDLAALADTCCVSLGQSVELTAFLTIAVSGLGMFFLARHLWGVSSGLLSAGLYVYAPYHLVDAFVRGAYSELTAFVWFPLILLFMILWWQTENKLWILLGSLSLAALVLTHNIMPMIFLPCLPILGLAMLGADLLKRRRTLVGWVIMALLGAALSSFFWIPILVETHWIQTEYFLQVDYRDEFVGIAQLLTTSLKYGLTSELGIPLVVSASCGLLAAVLSDQTAGTKRLLTFAALLSLGYILIMNYRSEFLWTKIRLLQLVQLPWRFLAPTTFFLSLMAGAFPAAIPSKWWRLGLAIAIPTLALQLHEPLIQIQKSITAEELEGIRVCQEVWGTQDYRPKWSSAAFWRSTKPPESFEDTPVLPPCANQVTMVPSGAGNILAFTIRGSTVTLKYEANEPVQLELPQFYYPSWVVRIDGAPVDTFPAPYTGLLLVQAPSGHHEVIAYVSSTGAQTIGLIVTGIGVLLALGVTAKILFDRKTSARAQTRITNSGETPVEDTCRGNASWEAPD